MAWQLRFCEKLENISQNHPDKFDLLRIVSILKLRALTLVIQAMKPTPPSSPRKGSKIPPLNLTKVKPTTNEKPLSNRDVTVSITTEAPHADYNIKLISKGYRRLYERKAASESTKDRDSLTAIVDTKLQNITSKTGVERAKAILDLGRNVILVKKNKLGQDSINKIIKLIPDWIKDDSGWEVPMDALWLVDVLREKGYLDKNRFAQLKKEVSSHSDDFRVNENARRLINNLNFFEQYYAFAGTQSKTAEKQQALKDKDAEIATLTKNLSKEEKNKKEINEDLEKAKEQYKALSEQFEKTKREFEIVNQENKVITTDLKTQSSKLENKNAEIEDLKRELSNEKQISEEFNKHAVTTQQKLEDKDAKIKTLNQELLKKEKYKQLANKILAKEKERNDKLNNQLQEAKKELVTAQESASRLQQEQVSKLNYKIEEQNTNIENLESELRVEKKANEAIIKRSQELVQKNNEIEAKYNEMSKTALEAMIITIEALEDRDHVNRQNLEQSTLNRRNKASIVYLESQQEALQENLQAKQTQLDEEQAKRNQLEAELEKIGEERQQAETKNRILEKKNRELTATNKFYREAKAENARLKEENNALKEKEVKNEIYFERLHQESLRLKTETKLKLEEKLKAEQQNTQQQQKEIEALKEENEKIKISFAQEKLNFEIQLSAREAELINQKDANRSDIEELQSQFDKAQERQRKKINDIEKENLGLKTQLSEQAARLRQEQEKSNETTLQELRAENERLQTKLDSQQIEIETKKKEKDLLARTNTTQRNDNIRLNAAQKESAQQIESLFDLNQNQVKEIKQLQAQLKSATVQIKELEQTTARAKDALENQLMQQNAAHAEQLQQLRNVQQEELRRAYQAIQAEHTNAQAFVDQELATRTQALTAEQQRVLDQRDQEIADLRGQVQSQQNSITQLQQAGQLNADATTTVEQQQRQLSQMQADIQQVTQQLTELQNQLQQSQQQIQNQTQALQNVTAENATFRAELHARDQILQNIKNRAIETAKAQFVNLSRLGDYQAALEALNSALYFKGDVDDEETRQPVINKINTLIEAGRYPEAITLANRLKQSPRLSPDIRALLSANIARAHNGLGNYAEALQSSPLNIIDQISDDKHRALIISEAARALSGMGQHREAISALNQITNETLNNLPAETQATIIANRTRALNGLREYREALRLTSEALQVLRVDKTARAELLLQKAWAQNALGQYHQAGITTTEGLSSLGTLTTPNLTAELLLEQAQAHLNLGHNDAAIAMLQNLIQSIEAQGILANEEVKAAACSLLSKVFVEKNNFDAAFEAAQLGLNQRNISNYMRAKLLTDLSSAYMLLSTTEGKELAKKTINEALGLDGLSRNQRALLLSHLSEIYFQHKKYEEAAKSAQSGLDNAEANDVKAITAYDLCQALIGSRNINLIKQAFEIASKALTLEGISDSQKGKLIEMQAMALTHEPDGNERAAAVILYGINNLHIQDPNVRADLYISLGQEFNAVGSSDNANAYQIAMITAVQGLTIEGLDAFSRASLQHVLAEAYLGLRQFEAAYNAAEVGVGANGDSDIVNLQLYLVAIEALLRMDRRNEAANLAQKAFQAYPNGEKEILDDIGALFIHSSQ